MLQGAQQDTVDVGKGMGSVWLAVIVLTVLMYILQGTDAEQRDHQ